MRRLSQSVISFTLCMLLLAATALAQLTTTTATVQDSDGTQWGNGAYTIVYVPPSSSSGAPTVNGQFLCTLMGVSCTGNITVSGILGSSGQFSVSLGDTALINPSGSSWKFTVCSAVSSSTCYSTNVAVTGASQDVSTQINAVIVPPRVTGVGIPSAYDDIEVSTANYNMYFRLLDNTLRCYNGSIWNSCGGGGGGGGGNVSTAVALPVDNVITGIGGSNIQNSGVAISSLAPLASPAFTGTVTLPITGLSQCVGVNSSGVVSGSGTSCNNATSIQGTAISSSSPTASQVLEFNGTIYAPTTLTTVTPQGSTCQVQYNASGAFGGVPLCWTPATPQLAFIQGSGGSPLAAGPSLFLRSYYSSSTTGTPATLGIEQDTDSGGATSGTVGAALNILNVVNNSGGTTGTIRGIILNPLSNLGGASIPQYEGISFDDLSTAHSTRDLAIALYNFPNTGGHRAVLVSNGGQSEFDGPLFIGTTNSTGGSPSSTSVITLLTGSGSPESVLSANPGSYYGDYTNGIAYIKASGTGNTGWIQYVKSVFGRVGAVTATSGDYTVSQVTGAAPLASPTFTGNVTLPITGATQCLHVDALGVVTGTGSDCGAGGGGSAFSGGLGTSFQDVGQIAAPANPASGNCRLYFDTTSQLLTGLTSTGANCVPNPTSVAFNTITSGTNTIAALHVGTGASLNATGSGTITATAVPFSGVSGTPTTLAGYGITDAVPSSRTVNSKALTSNITLTLASSDFSAQGGASNVVLHGSLAGNPSWGQVVLSTDVTGNLGVTNLDSGTSASSSTWWNGGGHWTTPALGQITATFSAPLSLSTNTLSCPTCVTSAASLTANAVVIGGGSQASSTISTDTTVGHFLGAAAGAPNFRAILNSDLPSPLTANTTGTASNLSGTPALPNGTTATTQTTGDNTTKLATDAFVLANAATNPLTAIGQVYGGGTSGTPTAIAAGKTGQILTSLNGATPSFSSPGVANGNGGSSVTTTPYSIQCDSSTALVDRSTTILFGSGASVVNIPAHTTSGCDQNMTFVLVNDGAGTLTVNRGGSDTFSVFDGSSATDAQTSFTFTSGQSAVVNNGTGAVWNARISKGSTGSVTSVSNSDSTLTISPTSGAVVASLNLGNTNTWTALQTFGTNISIGGVTATGATGSGNVSFSASPTFTGTLGGAAETLTGIFTDSKAGAASASSFNLTGAPFTGGTATTTFPLAFINQGAAVTTWSTSGTELGIDAPTSYAGNFLDFHVDGGATHFKVDAVGDVSQAGFSDFGEVSAPSGVASHGRIWADSTAHWLEFNNNNGTAEPIAGMNGSVTTNHVACIGSATEVKDCGITAASVGTVTSVGLAGTANQVTVTGTSPITTSGSWTLSLPTAVILGTDNSAAGTLQLANSAANAHTVWASGAVATNTIQGFATVPTTGHLVDCTVTSTTCLFHDSGVVTANVVNASSPGAGIAHFAGSTQTVTSSAIVAADITSATITHTQTDSTFPTLVGGSTAAMGTGAITSGTCATVVTVAITGALTTDTIVYTPNVDPTGVTGYAPSASGSLYIWAYPTSGNANFKVCNNTSGSITPSALTLNFKVIR